MAHDEDKIEDYVLALLSLTLHDGRRAWKGFDWETLERLHEKGYIENPRNKNKSVLLTEAGLARSRRLFEQLIGKDTGDGIHPTGPTRKTPLPEP